MFNAQCVNLQKAERRRLCRRRMKLVFCHMMQLDLISDVTKLETNLIEDYF